MNAAWIDHPDSLPGSPGSGALGLDTEFMRRNTYFPKLALVQAALAGTGWLLDPLAYDAGADVRALVGGRVCVMHSAGEDMEALAPLLDGTPLALFDTQIAAAMCGMGPGLSYQKLVASVLGIDSTRVYRLSFAIGLLVLGAAGALLLPLYPVNPFVGDIFGLRAFVIVVLGGIGSVAGAFWGGILVGVLESVGSQLIPITYAEALIFLLFLATMYFRPSGLFGGWITWGTS